MKRISIEGETNINNFNYYYLVPDKDSIPVNYGIPICKSDTDIVIYKIPVLAFKGETSAMLDDFRELLKASEHPYIIVEINKNIFREIVRGNLPELNLKLTLAGVTNQLTSNYKIESRTKKMIHIKGNFFVHPIDYNIEPPKRFFGLIHVGDKLLINFDIILFERIKNQN